VAARSKAWTVFARSNTGIVGSNATRGMHVCVHSFCVCAVLCVDSGLATGWSPVQRVLPTVYRLRNWKRGQSPKRCRARDRQKLHYYVHRSPQNVPIPIRTKWIQSPPHTLQLGHFNIVLYICLSFPRRLFPSGFPTKTSYSFLFSPTHHHIIIWSTQFHQPKHIWRGSCQ
jgi:hypothetical protein